MGDAAALLEAIQQAPDDDTLRLVYADWLEDNGDTERAEFIRVQIETERQRNGSPEFIRLTDRAAELLGQHGSLWARGCQPPIPVGAVSSVYKTTLLAEHGIMFLQGRRDERNGYWLDLYSKLWFRRGFVDEIDLTPEQFFSLDPAVLRPIGPLPTLRLQIQVRNDYSVGTLGDFVRQSASAPLLSRFRDVCIHGGFSSTTGEELRLLANEPSLLAKLGGLRLSEDPHGDPDILPLLESPFLTGLRELALDSTDCTEAVARVLVRSDRFRNMTYLHLSGVIKGARGLRVFATPGRWPRLRWLILSGCGLDNLTLRGMTRPGAFPALEMLGLDNNPIHFNALRALLLSKALPRLRRLGLVATPLTQDEVQALRTEFAHRVEIVFPGPRPRSPENADAPTDPNASANPFQDVPFAVPRWLIE